MHRTIVIGLLLAGLSGGANAALFDRGGGMIYDDVLNITWLQDANLAGNMTWDDSVAWADGLSYGGFDDWRLPSMDVNMDDTIINCNDASEMVCRDNELGYMFYQNLMGSSGDNLTGTQGLFTNIPPIHWSGTEFARNASLAWYFVFFNGGQGFVNKDLNRAVWAVRPGDVAAIPLPAGIWLLGSALLGVAGMREKVSGLFRILSSSKTDTSERFRHRI